MNRPIYVLSVPASGTRFLAQRVLAGPRPVKTYHIGTSGNTEYDDTVQAWLAAGPVVMPVRDPMLTMISNINRSRDVTWASLAALAMIGENWPTVHVFRVDATEEQRNAEVEAVFRHTGQVATLVDWAPDPEWRMPDRTGLKAAYLAGEDRDELHGIAAELNASSIVRKFFARLGYTIGPKREVAVPGPRM